MTDRVIIEVPGKPTPKQGGRSARLTTGQTIHYQPEKVRNYAAFVSMCAREAMNGAEPWTGPVHRTVHVLRCMPKAWSKKRRLRHNPCTTTPDLSRICENIDDALQGIVYQNDRQITSNSARKEYSDVDKVVIIVQRLPE